MYERSHHNGPSRELCPLSWLLDSQDPSVRYWALRDLMDRPEDDTIVRRAREDIQHSTPVTVILSHQQPDGSWGTTDNQWNERGTVFTLLLLGELGVESCSQTEKALDYLHSRYQEPSGRIYYRPVDKASSHSRRSPTWGWCMTAVTLRAALLLGHTDHPLTREALSFLEKNHENIGGWSCSAYSRNPAKVRPPNCYMGTIKALSALSLIPEKRRSDRVREIIEREVNTCLDNRVYLYHIDRNGQATPKRAWFKFAFPRYWRSDILEATDVLTSLGVRDLRLRDALSVIRSKQSSDGAWRLDFSETRRAWITIDEVGEPSKWVTLRALRTLRRTEQISQISSVECRTESFCSS